MQAQRDQLTAVADGEHKGRGISRGTLVQSSDASVCDRVSADVCSLHRPQPRVRRRRCGGVIGCQPISPARDGWIEGASCCCAGGGCKEAGCREERRHVRAVGERRRASGQARGDSGFRAQLNPALSEPPRRPGGQRGAGGRPGVGARAPVRQHARTTVATRCSMSVKSPGAIEEVELREGLPE